MQQHPCLFHQGKSLETLVTGHLIRFVKDNRPNEASSLYVKEKNIIHLAILFLLPFYFAITALISFYLFCVSLLGLNMIFFLQ